MARNFVLEVMDQGGTWIDMSRDMGSPSMPVLKKSSRLHRDLSGQVNTCKIKLHNNDRFLEIAARNDDVPVRITKNGDRWFTGILRDRAEGDYDSQLSSATIEAVDASYKLRDKPRDHLTYQNREVSSDTNTGGGIIQFMLRGFGLQDAEFNTLHVSQKIIRYAYNRAEDRTWSDLLNEFLNEYGYVLNVDKDGIWNMVDLFPLSISVEGTITDDDMEREESSFKRKRRTRRYEGVRVTWHPHITLNGIEIFKLSEKTIELDANEWFPDGTDVNDVFSVYKTPDGYELIAAYNVSLDWDKIGTITLQTEQYGPKRALIEFRGGASQGGRLTKFELTGDAVVRDTLQEKRRVLRLSPSTDRIEDIKSKWLVAESWVSRLVSGRAKWYRHGSWTIAFEGEEYEVGQAWRLNSSMLGIDVLVRVISIDENEFGRQRIVAEQLPSEIPLP